MGCRPPPRRSGSSRSDGGLARRRAGAAPSGCRCGSWVPGEAGDVVAPLLEQGRRLGADEQVSLVLPDQPGQRLSLRLGQPLALLLEMQLLEGGDHVSGQTTACRLPERL